MLKERELHGAVRDMPCAPHGLNVVAVDYLQ